MLYKQSKRRVSIWSGQKLKSWGKKKTLQISWKLLENLGKEQNYGSKEKNDNYKIISLNLIDP